MNEIKLAFTNDDNHSSLTPEEIIRLMFEHTDESGRLFIPEWPYDNKDYDEPDMYYTCRMNWNEEDCEEIIREYQTLAERLKAITDEEPLKRIIEENRDIRPFTDLDADLTDVLTLKSSSEYAVYDVVIRSIRFCKLCAVNAPAVLINNEAQLLAQALVISQYAVRMDKIDSHTGAALELMHLLHEKAKLSEATEAYQQLLYNEQGAAAMQFLKVKGLTDETIRKFQLGYSGRMLDCIMIPVMDEEGNTVAFVRRKMDGDGPMYQITSQTERFDIKRTIYGLHLAKGNEEKELILCEGFMDVLLLHQEGFTNAVNTLGYDLTKEQAANIKKYADRVAISYDSDEYGKKEAARSAELLKEAGLTVIKLDLSPYKDPYDLLRKAGKIEYARRFEEAKTV